MVLASALGLWAAVLGQVGPPPPAPLAPVFRAALELSAHSLPSGPRGGGQDLFALAEPMLALDGGFDFGFEVGAPFRLRLLDEPPAQRGSDLAGLLRGADWDEPSDLGQLLRRLWLGSEAAAVSLRAGAQGSYTLGHGQLLSRYSNQLNPDYHPAGAALVGYLGPLRAELFASDVLGGRLFAGEAALDLARLFGGQEAAFDRYHLALSLAHDFGRAGGTAPPLTAAEVDLDVGLYRSERAQLFAFLGAGARPGVEGGPLGASLGLTGQTQLALSALGGRLEARTHGRGFRQGLFRGDYELARFSSTGLGLAPLAEERLAPGYSVYAETSFALGGDDPASRARGAAQASLAVEHFFMGRTDVDASVTLRLPKAQAEGGGRLLLTGLGGTSRTYLQLEARYRLARSVYALGYGGTVFFPQPEGTLSRGVFGGLGAGVDFER
jgi:hypothetical protein